MTHSSADENRAIRFIAGALASSTSEIATLPIDIAKVRLQV